MAVYQTYVLIRSQNVGAKFNNGTSRIECCHAHISVPQAEILQGRSFKTFMFQGDTLVILHRNYVGHRRRGNGVCRQRGSRWRNAAWRINTASSLFIVYCRSFTVIKHKVLPGMYHAPSLLMTRGWTLRRQYVSKKMFLSDCIASVSQKK